MSGKCARQPVELSVRHAVFHQRFDRMDGSVEPPPAKKRKAYMATYQEDWLRVFNGVIVKSKLGEHHACCVICSRDVNVSASGSYDVKSHMKSKLNERNAKSA